MTAVFVFRSKLCEHLLHPILETFKGLNLEFRLEVIADTRIQLRVFCKTNVSIQVIATYPMVGETTHWVDFKLLVFNSCRMWNQTDNGEKIGTKGSESGEMIKDEEHSKGARLTLE